MSETNQNIMETQRKASLPLYKAMKSMNIV